MVVFLSDWARFPKAIVDTKTRNTSFLKIVALYRDMGIDHYYFPLALLQPELQGVDPHDEKNLTLEQKVMILYEVDNNPWYYLREILIDTGAGFDIEDMMYQANRANIAAMWMLLANIDYIQIQPRQTGKSYGADGNALWLSYYRYRDTSLNLITKDESLRKSNIARLKKLRDGWPDYLNRNTSKDDNNQISLSCHALNNKYYTHVGQSSQKAANNLGRGLTSPFIQIDEGPFINFIEDTVSAAMGSTNTAREIAKRKGFPYATVFTTTAGNTEDRDGKYVYELMRSAAVWNEKFFDAKNRDELVELILTNSASLVPMVNLTMSALQLGKSERWLYEAVANARSAGDNVDRDYFNRWGSSGSTSLIPEHLAKIMRGSERTPLDNWVSKENYIFRWYEPLREQKQYILIVDTSNAVGRDDIGITLLDVRTGKTSGAAAFNETNLIHFAEWLVEFLDTYRNVTLIIENRYNAQVIIDYLLLKLPERGMDPFKRMFNRITQEAGDRHEDWAKIATSSANRAPHITNQYRNEFGFVTNADNRKFLFSNIMMNAAKECGQGTHDNQLIHQLLNLVVKNGRIDHKQGEHDDMVMSWLIGHWFLRYGRNLKQYGIDSNDVLVETAVDGEEPDVMEQYEQQRQKALQDQISDLTEQLRTAHDAMTIMRLEAQLKTLVDKVRYKDAQGKTFDAILEDAREARRLRYGNDGSVQLGKRRTGAMLLNGFRR